MAGRAGAAVLGLTLGVLWSAAVVGPLWTVLWGAALLAHRDARDWLGRGGALWLVGGILAALVVLWPAAFTKVSLLQTYGLRLYAVLFQGGREWGGAAAALGGFVRQSPALLAYALLGLFACAVGLARGHRDALACGAAAVAFMVVILPFAIIDRYLLPLLPLAVLSAVALASPGDPERAPAQGRRARWTPPLVVAGVVACWALGAGFQYPQRGVERGSASGIRPRRHGRAGRDRSTGRGGAHLPLLRRREHAAAGAGELRRPPPLAARRCALRHRLTRPQRDGRAPAARSAADRCYPSPPAPSGGWRHTLAPPSGGTKTGCANPSPSVGGGAIDRVAGGAGGQRGGKVEERSPWRDRPPRG